KRLINIAPFPKCCARIGSSALDQFAIFSSPPDALIPRQLVSLAMAIRGVNLQPKQTILAKRHAAVETEHGADVVFSAIVEMLAAMDAATTIAVVRKPERLPDPDARLGNISVNQPVVGKAFFAAMIHDLDGELIHQIHDYRIDFERHVLQ